MGNRVQIFEYVNTEGARESDKQAKSIKAKSISSSPLHNRMY